MSSPPDSKSIDKDHNSSSSPSSPARSPSRSNSGSGRRSTSRNKDKSATGASASATTGTPNAGSHQRKASGRGGRRGSQGSASAPTGSEGMANLKNIISELKDDNATAAAAAPQPTGSPSRTGPRGGTTSAAGSQAGHRKNASGGMNNTPTIVAPPPSASSNSNNNSSTLNPNAGGFQPGTLGPISDMMDEGLITPTASSFDLMTGMPRQPGAGFFRAPNTTGATDFSTISAGELPEDIPGFGGVAGLNSRAFQFPQNQQSIAQQQALLQFQQQQQQFQMAQMAGLGFPQQQQQQQQQQPGGGGNSASDLMAEQLAIQQQLENLRLQQQNLMARYGDMQAQQGVGSPDPSASPRQSGPGHRRIQSQQQATGAMGSFGQGMGSFSGGFGSQSNLPKGHGRRHSVNVVNKSTPAISAASPAMTNASAFSPQMAMSPQMTMSPQMGGLAPGFGSGFSFPNNGGNQNQQHQQGNDEGYGPTHAGGFGHSRRQSGSMSSLNGWSMNTHSSGQANLAEAQSHLQQLAAYRASAGHSRVPSFGMSGVGGGPGQLAMAGYGGNLPAPGNPQQMRKSLFAPYLPQASIPPLLAAGKLVIGVLRVNKRNRSDAYVSTDVLDADIYVCGSKDRNRALEGDIVAIELLDVDEVWGTKKEKEEKKRKKEENASYDPRASRDLRKQDKKKDDVEVEGQGLMLFEEEEVNDEQKPQFAGHVVAVVERAPGQLFSGMLGVLRPSSAATQQKQDAERREREGVDLRNQSSPQQTPKIIWFRPTDKRVPLIAIPTEQAPADFIDRPDKYADRLFVACIKRWPITSLHPFGTLVEELGPIGDLETETNALLKDCNCAADDFTESVVKCLPPSPWTIPERELQPEIRRDFRSHRVFTIDPETAKDLDDALHIVKNEDGTFEVGVHIADVTHFVRPNTALDREARKRATTTYLVQRAVPMLPQALSEELCSLSPGLDKLTFSVVFTMSSDAKVLSTWYGKTLINSKVKLAYGDAQEVIDGKALPAKCEVTDESVTSTEIADDIKLMFGLSRQLRSRRFENGALRIDNVKVGFGLDEDGLPDDCYHLVRKEANELIEEFMLLANTSVAGKIAAGLPDQALLRRHEPPIERRLLGFVERMNRLGMDLDPSSAGALMMSISKITDPAQQVTLQHLSTKTMQRAKYFCSGMLDIAKYHHYALNLPLYTHFTSPIRRYADVMVHRQLEAVLLGAGDIKFTLDTEAISKVAQTCNSKKEAARLAQEQSAHLFLCFLINDLTQRYGPVIRPAKCIGVLDEAFDVLVEEFGIEKRCHLDQMPTENHVYDEHTNTLQIYWKPKVDVLAWLAESQNDAHLLRVARQIESTSASSEAESALFDDDDDDEGVSKVGSQSVKTTPQHLKSQDRSPPKFESIAVTPAGHHIQTVKELQTIPVCITADLTKSPPVIKVISLNPFK